jgi:hypothetical protein
MENENKENNNVIDEISESVSDVTTIEISDEVLNDTITGNSEDETDIESDDRQCVICLETEGELKYIKCDCKIKIHKNCLEQYIVNNNYSQTCPVCHESFNKKYYFYSERDNLITKYLLEKYMYFNEKFKNTYLIVLFNTSCCLLQVLYSVIILILLSVIFYLFIIVVGYLIKFILYIFQGTEFVYSFNNASHYSMGIYGVLLILIINLCFGTTNSNNRNNRNLENINIINF